MAVATSVIAGSAGELRGASAALSGSGRGLDSLDYAARRREVLSEFTLTGKLSVAASFLQDESEEGGGDSEERSQPLAKARQRLEQMEALAKGGGASVELTQAEYERRIAKLQRDLTRAWAANQRVMALKIAIQCSKLLCEPRVPAFYPSMFVLVSDILDTFGRLVFERLRSAAVEELGRIGGGQAGADLPPDFAAGDVGAEARETCRNWIYKTACIRELLPRLYIEMALLECYRFLHGTADFVPIIVRLSQSIRGIGDPLVAVHARWYLARQAAHLVHDPGRLRDTLSSTVTDFLYTFHEISPTGSRLAALEAAGIPLPLYLRLLSPAVGWIMAAVGAGAPAEAFRALLQTYRECCGNAMVLRHILDAFDGSFWSSHLEGMLQLVKEAAPGDIPLGLLQLALEGSSSSGSSSGGGSVGAATPAAADAASVTAIVTAAGLADLYRAMAGAMVAAPPPVDQRLPFLNEAWKAITRVKDAVTFSRHAAALIQLLLAAYSEREVVLLIGDLVRRLVAAGTAAAGGGGGAAGVLHAPAATLPHLQALLTTIVDAEAARMSSSRSGGGEGGGGAAAASFSGVITSENFSKLLDMFHSEAKPALCARLLQPLVRIPGAIGDSVVINLLCEMARAVHDQLDAFSSAEDRARACSLLCALVEKIDFGKDVERTLETLALVRQTLSNLDEVRVVLVERYLALAVRVGRRGSSGSSSGGSSSGGGGGTPSAAAPFPPKLLSFLRSAFSAAAVTIPAIEDPLQRLRLYSAAASTALAHSALSQADAFFQAAIREVPDIPAARAASAAAAVLSPPAPSSSSLPADQPPAAAALALDQAVAGHIAALARAALPMPGHPELGGTYLARGLLTAVAKYPWSPSPPHSPARPRATLSLLPLLQGWLADPPPYARIPGVDSNDVLYGGDAEHRAACQALHRAVLEAVVEQLGQAAEGGDRGVALEVACELLGKGSVARVLGCDEGCRGVLVGAVAVLSRLAPAHPALDAAKAALGC